MKRIAIAIITLLIFSLTFPSQILAGSNGNVENKIEQSELTHPQLENEEIKQESETINKDYENTNKTERTTDEDNPDGNKSVKEANTNHTDEPSVIMEEKTKNIEDNSQEEHKTNKEKETVIEDNNSASNQEKVKKEKKQPDITRKTEMDSINRNKSVNQLTESKSDTITEKEIKKNNTSRIGHIRSLSVMIYKNLTDMSSYIAAGEEYTNRVYYIKEEAYVNEDTYYLISLEPSRINGVVGWVKAKDMSTYTHTGIDSKTKTFYIKGTGSAYSKAWGGSKDLVYSDMKKFEDQKFTVYLTEAVGNNTWYRGKLNGQIIWLHEAYVKSYTKSPTSRIGHIRSESVKIYRTLDDQDSAVTAGEEYTNQVYYIKEQAQLGSQVYYLISLEPSMISGVVGWVKAEDMSTYTHTGIDSKTKTFYIKGTGSAYSKAWGGSKDLVYEDMSQYQNQEFIVYLTEAVGNNIWYRGKLNGQTIWLHEAYVVEHSQSHTSKLGHIVSSNVKIYKHPYGESSYKIAGEEYTNQVYYIKEQAVTNGQTYYLISIEPSRINGVVGWVRAEDMSTYTHTGIDRKTKTFYIKGTGSAYSKAWGGSKDLVYEDMSQYENQEFTVYLTEAVGNNTWYRGKLNGKTIWLHEAYVKSSIQSHTSKLGHIRSTSVKIFNSLESDSTYTTAGEKYTNQVYYIKEQAISKEQTYYLISLEPSRERGVVGWVKAEDLSTNPHVGVDSKTKLFSIEGSGNAYAKAWGGSKDIVYGDLSKYENQLFTVNLTERVGGNIWYRGILNNKEVWIHESFLNEYVNSNTYYDLTFSEALQAQINANAQTTNEYKTYVSKRYINDQDKVYNAQVLNVRGGPSTNYWIVGQITEGTRVTILDEVNGWYEIEFTKYHQFVNASPTDIAYYMNPDNFINNKYQKFQFLDLSLNSSADATNLNRILEGNGILEGMGGAFIEGGLKYHVNDVYLVSHAKLETGNGTSELATGISRWVKRDMDNDGKIVRDKNGNPIIMDISPRKVYNMYGVGAFDGCAYDCGAQTAYENGWFDVRTAIIEGAQFIGRYYVNAGQNTIYEMRWNYSSSGYATHQYATDIGWASKQVYTMYDLYQQLESYVIYLDIPVYKG
ncbi:mannosyl-glycoprotein endo-beta-N-acetylglucosamidase [Virgibacillus phasianinus]|uniref:Mannosyl-glycoprotein endo-beta-N-acetylglucosamidase n=1 Tax=Virgibacillus phasianinus TaxID=2017483 RepID=A0A220U315_9BACI|nr:GW dipeptide domain-containing protein [Virgibacillus phasianinus]ASK62143.1 mannosyl-glycoprotein endo-beta-N-acetylglucosamidase [Virgibacillus phasianinus]